MDDTACRAFQLTACRSTGAASWTGRRVADPESRFRICPSVDRATLRRGRITRAIDWRWRCAQGPDRLDACPCVPMKGRQTAFWTGLCRAPGHTCAFWRGCSGRSRPSVASADRLACSPASKPDVYSIRASQVRTSGRWTIGQFAEVGRRRSSAARLDRLGHGSFTRRISKSF